MTSLVEFTWLIEKYELHELLNKPDRNNTKEQILIDSLVNSKEWSESKAKNLLYDEVSSEDAFRVLKSRTLHFLDDTMLKRFDIVAQKDQMLAAKIEVNKGLTLMDIYESSGAHANAYRVAKRLYKITLDNFAYFELERVVQYLMKFNVIKNRPKRYRYFSNILRRVTEVREDEQRINRLYLDLLMYLDVKKGVHKDERLIDQCVNLLTVKNEVLPALPSLNRLLWRSRISSTMYYNVRDNRITTTVLLKEWEDLFNFVIQNGQLLTPSLLLEICENSTKAHLLRGDMKEAEKLLFYASSYFKDKTHPQLLSIKRWEIIMKFHSSDGEGAWDFLKEALQGSLFESLNEEVQVEWSIIIELFRMFFPQKSLDDMSLSIKGYGRRKNTNLNIWFYIVEICHHLIEKDFVSAGQRLDSMRKYCKRNVSLELNQHFRPFIKCLYLITTHGRMPDTERANMLLKEVEKEKVWFVGTYVEYMPLSLILSGLSSLVKK